MLQRVARTCFAEDLGLGLVVAARSMRPWSGLVLVPATMELLGDRNWWWLPLWLDRILPVAYVDGSAGEAELVAGSESSVRGI